jgi:hypothetical protein
MDDLRSTSQGNEYASRCLDYLELRKNNLKVLFSDFLTTVILNREG